VSNDSIIQESSPLLTEAHTASRLGVSLPTLRRWRRYGKGPRHFRLGGIIRYRPEDVDAFITAHLISKEVA